MLLNRFSDARILAIGQGIVRPHHALEFWKLTDHLGEQIAFAKAHGVSDRCGVGTDRIGQCGGGLYQPVNLVADAAQVFLESDGMQRGLALA